MPSRRARPPSGPPKTPARSPDAATIRAAKEAALPSGPEHTMRDTDALLARHIEAQGDASAGTTAHAFYVVAQWTMLGVHQLDEQRARQGIPPVDDFAREVPKKSVTVPLWAAVAITAGWLRATRGDPSATGQPSKPEPFLEAFGLGREGGERTVTAALRAEERDLKLAIAVELAKRAAPALSDRAAFEAVAAEHGTSASTVSRAWKALGETAARVCADAGASDPGRP